MKRINRVLSLIATMAMISMCFAPAVIADGSQYKFYSDQDQGQLMQYVSENANRYFEAVERNPELYGLRSGADLSVSSPFSIFDGETGDITDHSGVLIYDRGEVVGYFWIVPVGHHMSMTMSLGNAENLDSLENENVRWVDEDGDIYAIGENHSELILDNKKIDTNMPSINDIDVTQSAVKTIMPIVVKASNNDRPTEMKNLRVNIVLQGNHPWCWAATCAAIINYEKDTNLTAEEVATYVFGSPIDRGGRWSDMKKAYDHWEMGDVYETRALTYDETKAAINSDSPIHMGLYSDIGGHSMTLRGYSKFNDGYILYSAIDPNYDNYVYFEGSENYYGSYYVLGGHNFYWERARMGW